MHKSLLIIYTLVLAVLTSCRTGGPPELSDIEVTPIQVKRYEEALFSLHPDSVAQGLEKLAPEFELFIGDNYRDTLSVIQILDFITERTNRVLAADVREMYPDLSWLEKDLARMFGYTRHYFGDFNIPEVYSYVSGLAYEDATFYADPAMIIALDMYLGEENPIYKNSGIPYYRARRMNHDHIIPEAAGSIAYALVGEITRGMTLLDHMIYHGKVLYFTESVAPWSNHATMIGFTPQQWEWCMANESNMWGFLIQNDLLFTTDYNAIKTFFQDGPFTGDFGNDSPPMTGRWIGWQIVRRYMERNQDTSLKELFTMNDAQEVLNRSGYKPGR